MTSAETARARLWAITTRDRIRLRDPRVLWWDRDDRYDPVFRQSMQCRCVIQPVTERPKGSPHPFAPPDDSANPPLPR